MQKIFSIVIMFSAHLCNAQNVGIGTTSPSEKLHVAGNIKSDTLKPAGIKLTPNAGEGKILTSDAGGNATWQENKASGAVGFGSWGDCATNGNISNYNPISDSTAIDDFFGEVVSISGNYAIVGARFDDVGSSIDQGSASIYFFNGIQWVLTQKLLDPSGSAYDGFGNSVFLSGSYAIVGAFTDDAFNVDQGSASIFRFDGTTWVLMEKIIDFDGGAGDSFGKSVSLSGNYAIIGANNNDVGPNPDQGSAFIYVFNGTSWVLMHTLYNTNPGAGDNFGESVSISGIHAIVGAPADNVGASDQGSASIYRFNGSAWILMQQITDPTGTAADFFGYSVSISGNYAVAGAVRDDVGANGDQGSASAFWFNGSAWVFIKKLTDPVGESSDMFGNSVSISGNYLIVGCAKDDINTPMDDMGSATAFVRVGNNWQKLQKITDPGGSNDDRFGTCVAIDGDTKNFVIGALGGNGKVVFGKIN